MKQNTAKQNEHCLTNFELTEYQQVLGDLVIQIYRQLIKCMESILQPLIGKETLWPNIVNNTSRSKHWSFFSSCCVLCAVASMLEPETSQGILGSIQTGLRKRSSSLPEEGTVTVEVLLQHLDHFHTIMSQHSMDPDLIKQVVKQQYYIICADTLNHLLLRKDMCSWSKGLQIRYSTQQFPAGCYHFS